MKYNYVNGTLVSVDHVGDAPIVITYAPQIPEDGEFFSKNLGRIEFIPLHGLEPITDQVFETQAEVMKFVENWIKQRAETIINGYSPFDTHRN